MARKRRSRRKGCKTPQPPTRENPETPLEPQHQEAASRCSVCSEHKSIKMPQCSHELCQKCIESVHMHGKADKFVCPICAQNSSFPANVTSLIIRKVNNLFLSTSVRTTEGQRTCSVHGDETVHFLCVPCDTIICLVCKLSEHEGHETKSLETAEFLAKERILDAAGGRLEDYTTCLKSAMKGVVTNQQEAKAMKQEAENSIRSRHTELLSLVDECRDSALLQLEALAVEIECKLQEELSSLQQELNLVSNIQKSVKGVLNDETDPQELFDLDRQVEEEWSEDYLTQQQLKVLPTCTYSIGHTVSDDVDDSDAGDGKKEREKLKFRFRSFIGQTLKKEIPIQRTTPGMKITPAFRCSKDPDALVMSVCPAGAGKLVVSFQTNFVDTSGLTMRTESFYEDGRPSKSFDFGLGSLGAEGQGMFRHGPLQKQVLWYRISCLFPKSAKKYLLIAVDDTCNIFEQSSILSSLSRLRILFFSPEPIVSIVGVDRPVAFDISNTTKVFALVYCVRDSELSLVRVLRLCKFRKCEFEEVETETDTGTDVGPAYEPSLENFMPSDVCFFNLYGKEVLLVSDQANHTIHVVNFDTETMSCTFKRFLVDNCPQMRHPTALNTDEKGRLWVACKGGQLLTVELNKL